MSKLTAALFMTAALALTASHSLAAERVLTASGALQGATVDGVTSFKGVPYAEPPVGALRWRPPVIKQPWPGVRVANQSGAICMQKYNATDNGVGPLPMSEDCLTLNLFAPANAKAGSRLPVMLWIHGGGLVNGSGTAALYDGSALARQGVIVVSINYRLGRFGYFAHPALTAEAGAAAVGNYGLMDQVEALRWVRRNITVFGGDPANVTIFGESAGGVSVNRLMMVPQARPLFAKAISQSGAGAERSVSLAEAEAAGVAFAQSLGVSANTVEALRAIPAEAIVKAGDLNMLAGAAPILDGRMLKEDALEAFRGGREARVPYLVGSNSLEIPPAFGAAFRAAGGLQPGAAGGGAGGLWLTGALRQTAAHRQRLRRAGARPREGARGHGGAHLPVSLLGSVGAGAKSLRRCHPCFGPAVRVPHPQRLTLADGRERCGAGQADQRLLGGLRQDRRSGRGRRLSVAALRSRRQANGLHQCGPAGEAGFRRCSAGCPLRRAGAAALRRLRVPS